MPNLKWKLISKYFEADLQFGVVDAYHPLLNNLESPFDAEDFIEQKIRQKYLKCEAFIYYFTDTKAILWKNTKALIETIQESFQAEMSSIFFDGPASPFDKSTDQAIEDLTSSYFIEYITQDLSKELPKYEWSSTGQSLLDEGNEKFGISRLHEALQCCMWSNMSKITTQPLVNMAKIDSILDQDKKIEQL